MLQCVGEEGRVLQFKDATGPYHKHPAIPLLYKNHVYDIEHIELGAWRDYTSMRVETLTVLKHISPNPHDRCRFTPVCHHILCNA